MRKALSKKERFSVFERDWFCCQYCWRDPIKFDVVLEVDHSISVKHWWTNIMENLVTSCFDCNRWKSRKSVIIWEIDIDWESEKLKQAQERLEQIKKIKTIRKKIEIIKDKQNNEVFWFINEIVKYYSEWLQKKMNMIIKGKYNKWVSIDLLEECLNITENKFATRDRFNTDDYARYFYWVLRSKLENEKF